MPGPVFISACIGLDSPCPSPHPLHKTLYPFLFLISPSPPTFSSPLFPLTSVIIFLHFFFLSFLILCPFSPRFFFFLLLFFKLLFFFFFRPSLLFMFPLLNFTLSLSLSLASLKHPLFSLYLQSLFFSSFFSLCFSLFYFIVLSLPFFRSSFPHSVVLFILFIFHHSSFHIL